MALSEYIARQNNMSNVSSEDTQLINGQLKNQVDQITGAVTNLNGELQALKVPSEVVDRLTSINSLLNGLGSSANSVLDIATAFDMVDDTLNSVCKSVQNMNTQLGSADAFKGIINQVQELNSSVATARQSLETLSNIAINIKGTENLDKISSVMNDLSKNITSTVDGINSLNEAKFGNGIDDYVNKSKSALDDLQKSITQFNENKDKLSLFDPKTQETEIKQSVDFIKTALMDVYTTCNNSFKLSDDVTLQFKNLAQDIKEPIVKAVGDIYDNFAILITDVTNGFQQIFNTSNMTQFFNTINGGFQTTINQVGNLQQSYTGLAQAASGAATSMASVGASGSTGSYGGGVAVATPPMHGGGAGTGAGAGTSSGSPVPFQSTSYSSPPPAPPTPPPNAPINGPDFYKALFHRDMETLNDDLEKTQKSLYNLFESMTSSLSKMQIPDLWSSFDKARESAEKFDVVYKSIVNGVSPAVMQAQQELFINNVIPFAKHNQVMGDFQNKTNFDYNTQNIGNASNNVLDLHDQSYKNLQKVAQVNEDLKNKLFIDADKNGWTQDNRKNLNELVSQRHQLNHMMEHSNVVSADSQITAFEEVKKRALDDNHPYNNLVRGNLGKVNLGLINSAFGSLGSSTHGATVELSNLQSQADWGNSNSTLNWMQKANLNGAIDLKSAKGQAQKIDNLQQVINSHKVQIADNIKKYAEGDENALKAAKKEMQEMLLLTSELAKETKKLEETVKVSNKKDLDKSPDAKKATDEISKIVNSSSSASKEVLDLAEKLNMEHAKGYDELKKDNDELEKAKKHMDDLKSKTTNWVDTLKEVGSAFAAPLKMITGLMGALGVMGIGKFMTGTLDYYNKQGQWTAEGTLAGNSIGGVGEAGAAGARQRVEQEGLRLHSISHGMIDFNEAGQNYNQMARNVGGHYMSSGTQAASDLNEMNESTLLMKKVYGVQDGTMNDALNTYYKDLGMGAKEAAGAIMDLAQTAVSSQVPVDKYIKTVSGLASQFRQAGLNGKLAAGMVSQFMHEGMRFDDAVKMTGAMQQGVSKFAEDDSNLAFAGVMSGQFNDPFKAIRVGRDRWDENGDVKEGATKSITSSIDYMANMYKGLGQGDTAWMFVNDFMKKDLGMSSKEASQATNMYMKDPKMFEKWFAKNQPKDEKDILKDGLASLETAIKTAGDQQSGMTKLNAEMQEKQYQLASDSKKLLDGIAGTVGEFANAVWDKFKDYIKQITDLMNVIAGHPFFKGAIDTVAKNFHDNPIGTVAAGALAVGGASALGKYGLKKGSNLAWQGLRWMGSKTVDAVKNMFTGGGGGTGGAGGAGGGGASGGSGILSGIKNTLSRLGTKGKIAVGVGTGLAALWGYSKASANPLHGEEPNGDDGIFGAIYKKLDEIYNVLSGGHGGSDKLGLMNHSEGNMAGGMVMGGLAFTALKGKMPSIFGRGGEKAVEEVAEAEATKAGLQAVEKKSIGSLLKAGLRTSSRNALLDVALNAYDGYTEIQDKKASGHYVQGDVGKTVADKGVNTVWGTGGAILGGALGSLLGPAGTIAGGMAGAYLGNWAGEKFNETTADENGRGWNDKIKDNLTYAFTGKSQAEIEADRALTMVDGNSIDENGAIYDENGNMIDSNQQLIDVNGNVVDSTGKLTDANGKLIEQSKALATSNGDLKLENGKVIKASELVVDANGKLRDSHGNVINSNGLLITKNKELVDVNGNVIKANQAVVEALKGYAAKNQDKTIHKQYETSNPEEKSWFQKSVDWVKNLFGGSDNASSPVVDTSNTYYMGDGIYTTLPSDSSANSPVVDQSLQPDTTTPSYGVADFRKSEDTNEKVDQIVSGDSPVNYEEKRQKQKEDMVNAHKNANKAIEDNQLTELKRLVEHKEAINNLNEDQKKALNYVETRIKEGSIKNESQMNILIELLRNINMGGKGGTGTVGSDYDVRKNSGITAEKLNSKLGGVFAGQGQTIIDIAKQAGVDPAVMAAIMMQETGNGTSSAVKEYNNPGGIMGANGLKQYGSLTQGMYAVAETLKGFVKDGEFTLGKIAQGYAPTGAANDPNHLNENWLPNVVKFMNELGVGASLTGVNFGQADMSNSIVQRGMKYAGTPYVWGGKDINNDGGLDCTGFVSQVYKGGGNMLEGSDQYENMKSNGRTFKDMSQAKVGDLVFFSNTTTKAQGEDGWSHIGIYAGNGQFMQASSSKGVTMSGLNEEYWKEHFLSFGSVAGLNTNGQPGDMGAGTIPTTTPSTVTSTAPEKDLMGTNSDMAKYKLLGGISPSAMTQQFSNDVYSRANFSIMDKYIGEHSQGEKSVMNAQKTSRELYLQAMGNSKYDNPFGANMSDIYGKTQDTLSSNTDADKTSPNVQITVMSDNDKDAKFVEGLKDAVTRLSQQIYGTDAKMENVEQNVAALTAALNNMRQNGK